MDELEQLVSRVVATCRRTIALYDADAQERRERGEKVGVTVARHSLGSIETGLQAILRRVQKMAAEDSETGT